MKSVSLFLIFAGIVSIILGTYFVWERNNPNTLSFSNYPESNYTNYNEYPIRIRISSIHVDLPIVQSRIKNAQWETTKEGVSYLISSPIPGQKGNSVLYGHNWNTLLGSLHSAQPGDQIEIEYNSGVKRVFTINAMGTVTPDQTHVLFPSNDVRITLYTCTGFLDRKRLVVTATLDNTISRSIQFADGEFMYEQ